MGMRTIIVLIKQGDDGVITFKYHRAAAPVR